MSDTNSDVDQQDFVFARERLHVLIASSKGPLSSVLLIILEGRFAISRTDLPVVPVFFKNHKSWEENPAAQKALWPVIAQYLIKGQFEGVRDGEPLPLCILPMGAVPKNTPPLWRLILDCRYTNRFIDRWPVKYLSMAALSLLLSWNCFFCVADIQAAYLMTQLGGCGRATRKVKRLKTNQAQTGYIEWEGGVSGCEPANRTHSHLFSAAPITRRPHPPPHRRPSPLLFALGTERHVVPGQRPRPSNYCLKLYLLIIHLNLTRVPSGPPMGEGLGLLS